MITIHTCIYTPRVYNKKVYVDLLFPAIPVISNDVFLPEEALQTLIIKALESQQTLKDFISFLTPDGKILSFDSCHVIREIDWYPGQERNTMECYIFLGPPEGEDVQTMDSDNIDEKIINDEYDDIVKSTYRAYGITNAKKWITNLFLRNA